MLLFKTVTDLQAHITELKNSNKNIGFVPTMGALHAGHISLIEAAKRENDIIVCSIFVNPTQFNDKDDLVKYPRTIEQDIALLSNEGCNILFLPEVEEIYPPNLKTPNFDFGNLDQPMEGAFRPGHFDGVAQVVYRLLDIVKPHSLYMGQKDYQQWAIIQSMLQQLGSGIQLVRCPIKREQDGLAMSSRNIRLPKDARQIAPNIHKILQQARKDIQTLSVNETKKKAIQALNAISEFKLDYFEIADGTTLEEVIKKDNSETIVACTAVFLAKVRLIDNMILKGG